MKLKPKALMTELGIDQDEATTYILVLNQIKLRGRYTEKEIERTHERFVAQFRHDGDSLVVIARGQLQQIWDWYHSEGRRPPRARHKVPETPLGKEERGTFYGIRMASLKEDLWNLFFLKNYFYLNPRTNLKHIHFHWTGQPLRYCICPMRPGKLVLSFGEEHEEITRDRFTVEGLKRLIHAIREREEWETYKAKRAIKEE